MIRTSISKKSEFLLGLSSLLIMVALYSLMSWRQHSINPDDTTIPNLPQFVEGVKKIITPNKIGEIWLIEDSLATFGRLFCGLFVGVLFSVVVGVAMGCFPAVEAFFLPPLSLFAKVPPTAMTVVFFVVCGTGLPFYVAMVALIFPILTQSVYQSAKYDVTDHSVYKAYTLGASNFEVIWHVVFRQILPRVIESIRLQIGPALILLIAAETLMGDVGFGYRLRIQGRQTNMNVVFLYLAILSFIFYTMDYGLSFLRRKICNWYG